MHPFDNWFKGITRVTAIQSRELVQAWHELVPAHSPLNPSSLFILSATRKSVKFSWPTRWPLQRLFCLRIKQVEQTSFKLKRWTEALIKPCSIIAHFPGRSTATSRAAALASFLPSALDAQPGTHIHTQPYLRCIVRMALTASAVD
jgi:hypothetical protein